MTDFDLGTVPLFSGIPEEDLERLGNGISEVHLDRGETLFDEGDDADRAYVVADGELEILKESAGHNVRIAVSGPGTVVGEMALLTGEPRNAGARALSGVTLVAIPRSCLEDVLSTSVEANHALFSVFIERWREQESRVRQSEKMAQIGVLTAGLAHEMNNPAAAVTAGAESLTAAVANVIDIARKLPPDTALPTPSHPGQALSAMGRADVEESIALVLQSSGIGEAWNLASSLAESGYIADDLAGQSADAVAFASASAGMTSLFGEISEGSRRLSELVGALKSYSFLDQAPVQEVDVTKGINDTLLILRSKTKDIAITTEFPDDLPTIVAFGSQLNQVWTNLIDNAADAIHESGIPDGTITIKAHAHDGNIVVEVANGGPAIPDDVVGRIFEAFYTTKEPGKGTGLGLDTAYSIVVNQHRGSISVVSEPGHTVFTVTLPITQDPDQ